MKFGTSQSMRRVEDIRFLTGRGRYTDDISVPGQLHGLVVRSPVAHGRITELDVAAARAAPGVVAVVTAADLGDAGPLPCKAPINNADGSPRAEIGRPLLAADKVCHVGDGLAFIVAETPAQARDAAEEIMMDFEVLDAVVDTASAQDSPTIHDGAPGNLCMDWAQGDRAAVDQALDAAAHVVELDLVNNRVVAASMEPRGVLAVPESDGRLTVYSGTQGGWDIKKMLAEHVLHCPAEDLHVVTPDVGGGFGMKIFCYPEHGLVAWAARALGRPVKWIADRSDAFLADTQGRDHVTTARLALDDQGRILALDVDTIANLGAYLSNFAPFIPSGAAVKILTGVYDIPVMHYRVRGVFTNTVPVDAYRGAGRPESIYMIERLMDHAARQTGFDRVDLRRRNMIPPDAMPHTTATGSVYDSGAFAAVLDTALARADWAGFESRRAEALGRGRRRGIGLSCYIESVMGAPKENCHIRFHDDAVEVRVGTQSNGQGHETAYTQLVAEQLGLDPAAVRIVQGDTDLIPRGYGTGGSRSLTAQGWAILDAIAAARERGRAYAAQALQADPAEVVFEDGAFRAGGRSIGLLALAAQARSMPAPDPETEGGLDVDAQAHIPAYSFPNGCHVCEVEVDPDDGTVTVERYHVVDDFGVLLNPLLVEGQVVGGVVQGLGQALSEHTVYDPDGQILTASFLDYALPRADHMPAVDFHHQGTPCANNPMGVKGCGEAGTVAAPAAVINALIDALAPLGVTGLDMPATPARLWHALRTVARE